MDNIGAFDKNNSCSLFELGNSDIKFRNKSGCGDNEIQRNLKAIWGF